MVRTSKLCKTSTPTYSLTSPSLIANQVRFSLLLFRAVNLKFTIIVFIEQKIIGRRKAIERNFLTILQQRMVLKPWHLKTGTK
jgi:hypothetical protein